MADTISTPIICTIWMKSILMMRCFRSACTCSICWEELTFDFDAESGGWLHIFHLFLFETVEEVSKKIQLVLQSIDSVSVWETAPVKNSRHFKGSDALIQLDFFNPRKKSFLCVVFTIFCFKLEFLLLPESEKIVKTTHKKIFSLGLKKSNCNN